MDFQYYWRPLHRFFRRTDGGRDRLLWEPSVGGRSRGDLFAFGEGVLC